jgi:DNA-directed RNA polymerase alpha subunit
MSKSTNPQNLAGDFPKISRPALRALANAGYNQLEQLAQVSESELGKLHGMGPKALGLLKQSLAEKGLAFRPD